jgi:hypothetical protein
MFSCTALRSSAFCSALVALLALTFLVSVPVYAQVSGGTLSGTITDVSGAAIPHAQLLIKNVATGVTREVTTDSDGFYSAPNLLPGIYDVTISARGFGTVVESNLSLAVGEERSLNGTMQVGQVSEKVEVSAAASTVQLGSSTVSSAVNSTTVRELPLNGRDWTQLAALQPGVVNDRTQPSTGSITTGRAARGFGNQLSDAGHRPNENNYRVNGISVNDYANEGPGSVIGGALGVDAIQEFSVLTSDYTAEYGSTSGAVITAITKSGTNAFHGDAFWFLRDKSLDARNYFDTTLPPFHRNQFGASGGGPIRKDKTFIFAAYEGIRQDQSISFSDTVLSPAARNGQVHVGSTLCTIGVASPGCTLMNSAGTVGVDPKVAPYLGFYPTPNGGLIGNGDTGVFDTAGLAHFTEDYVTVRGDHKISDKDSLAGSWFRDNAPFTEPDPLLVGITELLAFRQMVSLEETHIFNSTLLNTARIGFNRDNAQSQKPIRTINPLGANPSLAAVPGRFAPILTVPGLTQMSGALGDPAQASNILNSFQIYDDAFLTRGTHSLKFGFAWDRMQYNRLNRSKQNGTFKFPSLTGFLEDDPTNVQLLDPSVSQEVGTRQTVFGAYLQDDWRWRSNLTLNFGLRYEPTTNPTEAHNQFQLIQNLFTGGALPVKTLFPSNPTLTNFEPRVGFAWDPFSNGKTAVRGGFGIFDVLPINWLYTSTLANSLPFALQATQGKLPAGSFPTGALALVGFNPAKALQRYIEPNPPHIYAMNWNFNIQREIAPSLTMMIGYVGSHTVHQANTPNDSDVVLPTLTSAGYLWPFPVGSGSEFNPNVGSISATIWNGSSLYDALQVQVTKTMSHGFQAELSYTWGKCIDDGSGADLGDPFSNSIGTLLFFDRRKGPCDFNVGQNLVVNYVWHVPTPKFGGAAARYILGGWEVGGIFTAATGTPFTMVMGGDPLGQGNSDPWDFPDRLVGSGCANPVNPGNPNNYVKVNCFIPAVAPPSFAAVCQPAAASVAAMIPNTCMNLLGNEGRNSLTGPGLAQLDFSLFKNMPFQKFSESFNVQFRAEFFNILNRANFQSPVDNETIFNADGTAVGGAGKIDSTSTSSRQIQFGLKLIF